jgi:DNA-binding MarR family transcriptional regulator
MELDQEAAARVGIAWRELKRGASMNALRPVLLGPYADILDWGGVDTLDLLAVGDGVRMCDLADDLRVDASTATRAIQRLADLGLVERAPHPDDRRAVVVRASAAGVAAHADMAVRRRAALGDMLGRFSNTELVTLADLMERLVEAVDDLAAAAR